MTNIGSIPGCRENTFGLPCLFLGAVWPPKRLQEEWAAPGGSIPGCPAGLDYLKQVHQNTSYFRCLVATKAPTNRIGGPVDYIPGCPAGKVNTCIPPCIFTGAVWTPKRLQVEWAAPVGSIPGCPAGLEYLTQVDQLLVKQQVELFEG